MPIMAQDTLLCESFSIAGTAGSSKTSTNEIYIPQVEVGKTRGVFQNDRPNLDGRLALNIVVEDEDLKAAVDGSVVTFALYHHTATGAVTNGTVLVSQAITVNTTVVYSDGTKLFSLGLPFGQIKPYLELKVSVATQNLSTGKITAWIAPPTQEGQ